MLNIYPRSVNSMSEGLDHIFVPEASDLVVLTPADQRTLWRTKGDYNGNVPLEGKSEDGRRVGTLFKAVCSQGKEKVKARGCFFSTLMFLRVRKSFSDSATWSNSYGVKTEG